MKLIVALLAAIAAAGGSSVSAQPPASAQATARQAGTLNIVVKDQSGAVIPNAAVEVTGGDAATANVSAHPSSNGQGVATAPDLPPGRYTVSAAFPGFEKVTLKDVRVRAGEN